MVLLHLSTGKTLTSRRTRESTLDLLAKATRSGTYATLKIVEYNREIDLNPAHVVYVYPVAEDEVVPVQAER